MKERRDLGSTRQRLEMCERAGSGGWCRVGGQSEAATVWDGVYRRFEWEIDTRGSERVWRNLIPPVTAFPCLARKSASDASDGWMSALCFFNNSQSNRGRAKMAPKAKQR
jgi:hypothetical protein